MTMHVDGDQNRRIACRTCDFCLCQFVIDPTHGRAQPVIVDQRGLAAQVVRPNRVIAGVDGGTGIKSPSPSREHPAVFKPFNVQPMVMLPVHGKSSRNSRKKRHAGYQFKTR